MKKMLLVLTFPNVANLLKTIEPKLKNKTVAYIPTASSVNHQASYHIWRW